MGRKEGRGIESVVVGRFMEEDRGGREVNVQGWAKEWSLGCVNPASWLPLYAWCEFTQPRHPFFAQLGL